MRCRPPGTSTGEEPVLVSGVETRTDPVKFKEVEESIVWQAKFPSGVVAYCSASYNSGGFGRYTAKADGGWFELYPAYLLQRQPRPAQ